MNLHVQEPNHLDGTHGIEQVSYFVIEAGIGNYQMAVSYKMEESELSLSNSNEFI